MIDCAFECTSEKINFDWEDFFCLMAVLFVLFPWIALVIDAVLWLFGIPPIMAWDGGRIAFAVLWPMFWCCVVVPTI